jgi:hypothetical protein
MDNIFKFSKFDGSSNMDFEEYKTKLFALGALQGGYD